MFTCTKQKQKVHCETKSQTASVPLTGDNSSHFTVMKHDISAKQ